ncbi:MAG: acyl-CoA dehydrogenase [Desulfobacterales bacterium]
MAQVLADRRDIDFVIWEQMKGEEFLNNGHYEEFNRKVCDMMITEARKIAINEVYPTMKDGDQFGVRLENGNVYVPESYHRPYEILKEGEWGNLTVPEVMGGQGAPAFIGDAVSEYFMAANWSLYGYLTMGNGTAHMIQLYGTPEQKATYVENLTSGKWGGTMLLTESNAGSDVGALETTAVPNGDGTYSLTGNKIFITNGEHDLVENIIHPVLARIEGAPHGTKGISIFIVPKYLVNEDGSLGDQNDIACTGVEEKMGIHGSATCSMAIGSKGKCVGYLLGEENKGMKIMFHMMNGARMHTGLQGLAYASAAYMLAVNYARERIQGRDLENFSNHAAPSVPIIHHPDVRRNLLKMKSYVDGMRSFYYYASTIAMKLAHAETDEERAFYDDLYSLFTPIIKEYLAVKGHDVCIQAIQVYGGAGYTQDYPVEQYARDCKIASIYEGTSGIQAMDLLARKLGRQNGRIFQYFIDEVNNTIEAARGYDALSLSADRLDEAVRRLTEAVSAISAAAMSERFKAAFSHSLPLLDTMGDTIVGWMLLWRAVIAAEKLAGKPKKKDAMFYEGQIKTAEFYIRTLLPASMGIMDGIIDGSGAAVEMPAEAFGGM